MTMITTKLRMQLKVSSAREFGNSFLAVLGAISSVVTLISFVFNIQCPSHSLVIGYSCSIIVICLIIAFCMTKRKTRTTIRVSNNLSVTIETGDLFEKAIDQNYIVIPVNEYFDTIVNTTIISASSLHGQFIEKYFESKHLELHDMIESYLSKNKVEGVMEERQKSKGHKVRYPLGTCVPIPIGKVTYVLMALTHFDENDHAYIELSELGLCISKLCKFLSETAGNQPVYMPLIGMGLSRLNKNAQFILRYTLDTIVCIKDLAIPGGLIIEVSESVAKTLNLNEINY